jgi:CheY-like chemotaxis protein
MHVLIVDDDDNIRLILTMLLEHAGYTVAGRANGQEALAYLATTSNLPCVIVLDLMMPLMDGWEFRVQQLAEPVLAAIPVVVFSAAPPDDEAADTLRAVAVLQKPIEFASLLALVAQSCTASSIPCGAA